VASAAAAVVSVLAVGLLGACAEDEPSSEPSASAPAEPTSEPTERTATPPAASTGTASPTATPKPRASGKRKAERLPPDPRWQFFTDDRKRYASPWYRGRHRVMIPFGCTDAPWYRPDPACGGRGSHHGIDIATPCGTPLYAGRAARVIEPRGLGRAYGVRPVLLRIGQQDVLIAHAHRVFVKPGDRLRRGQKIALASDSASPDGCHLHFEVRPAGGDYLDAVDPAPLLRLS
jgi:murein DD-endopeptidase MepM/ murein hydrolase activator NlpD